MRLIFLFLLNAQFALGSDKIVIHPVLVDSSLLMPFIINPRFLTSEKIPQLGKINGFGCTATLIGPRVVLTAAHCIYNREGNWPEQSFFTFEGKEYFGTYTVHPSYQVPAALNIPHDLSAKNDIALGILKVQVKGILPMSVTPALPAVGSDIFFAGLGNPYLGSRQYGKMTVITLSSLGLTLRNSVQKVVGASGDSGGPSFIVDTNGAVKIFAVASSSTITKDLRKSLKWKEALPYTMGIVRVFPQFQSGEVSFIEKFANEKGVEICGVNLECPEIILKLEWP